MKLTAAALSLVLLAGCAKPMQPQNFGPTGTFDPMAFFTGHVTSWGVEENRAGQPIAIVTTDCHGSRNPDGSLTMVQVLHVGAAKPKTRTWHMRRTGAQTYAATANDMAGTAIGRTGGRALHWRWVLRNDPGNALANVTLDQWMYRMDGGAVVIRTVITKLGIRLVEVTEQFTPAA